MINIIGGSGFVGTKLCKLYSAITNSKFIVIDKIPSSIIRFHTKICDIRNIDSLRKSIFDQHLIINLAAEHRDDVSPLSLYQEVNVDGAINICLVASEKNIKTIIFTSSVAVYGFAPLNTDETGKILPFNEYGRTKYEAEKIYIAWQLEDPDERTLVIVRPTVVFGERNRGNVFNLLRQIASGKFIMVGNGENRKSMAYVDNLAAFLLHATTAFKPGIHIYNYIDKPDTTMNQLIKTVNKLLGKSVDIKFRLPYFLGYSIGKCFDALAFITGKKFTISSIRVKKFCSDSVFDTSIANTGFIPPVPLSEALERTIKYEFIESHADEEVFYSE
jgi:nucleoside-diphosphate-sugar epimerase